MGYQDIEVTERTADGGLDVTASYDVRLVRVKVAIQAKRWRYNIQRKALDELRGSLGRSQASLGLMMTTSDFSKGATEVAQAQGLAPIALINGQRLVELLLEHQVGVRREDHPLWFLDQDFLEALSRSQGEPTQTPLLPQSNPATKEDRNEQDHPEQPPTTLLHPSDGQEIPQSRPEP